MLSPKYVPSRTATVTAGLCLLLLGCSDGNGQDVEVTNGARTDATDATSATDAAEDDVIDASVGSPNGSSDDTPNGLMPTGATEPRTPGTSARDAGANAPSDPPAEPACPAGSYANGDGPSAACQEYTACAPGEFVQSDGTASSDRICTACSPGTYSDETNAAACSPWTECGWSESEMQPPSATLDRGCEPGSDFRFFDGAATSIAIDSQDNVLVGTNPGSVRKFDPTGGELWVDESLRGYEDVSVAVDGQNDVFVAMNSFDAYEILLSKYDANGTDVWRKTIKESPERPPSPLFVAVDAAGNALVTGTDGLHPFVTKFAPDGSQLWLDDPLDDPPGPTAFGTSIATNGDGNVLVAGDTNDTLPGIEGEFPGALFLLEYDADGSEIRREQFGTGGTVEEAHGIAVDSESNVLIAGYAQEGSDASADAFVRKCDPEGNEIWTRRFGTAEGDRAFALAVDGDDNVLVGGRTAGALDGANAGDYDAFVRLYDAAGNEIWTQQFGEGESDGVSALAVDSQGRVFAAGYLSGGAEGSGFVRRLPEP